MGTIVHRKEIILLLPDYKVITIVEIYTFRWRILVVDISLI